ncbi:MAG: DUF2147 domain-containing protein [Burkholderiales bacterium]|nr:DUF2147 domain-containing protein [Burkholderiales bacterium]
MPEFSRSAALRERGAAHAVPLRRGSAAALAAVVSAAVLSAGLLAGSAAWAQNAPSALPAGLWKTIDDETKQAKALVRVSESSGVFSGRIEKILTDKTDAVCDQCTDARKGKPVQGMTIVEGMRRNADQANLYDGGNILDPNNGKVYRGQMKLVDDGRKLEVRGYIGVPLFGRTQTWIREE